MSEQTAGQRRTAKARATRSRQTEERKAEELRARGWTCTPPRAAVGDTGKKAQS